MYNKEIINKIGKYLLDNGLTISTAESVTSGHLQAALSNGIEASNFFQGGITAYNVGQKARHLTIDPIHAQKVNSVDLKVARELALGANRMFISDYSIGITGYASVVPECEEEGLHAYYAIARGYEVVADGRIDSGAENGLPAQLDITDKVLEKLAAYLQEKSIP